MYACGLTSRWKYLAFGILAVVTPTRATLGGESPTTEELRHVDGTHENLELVDIAQETLTFRGQQRERRLAPSELVKWGRFADFRDGVLLVTVDGSRLVGRETLTEGLGIRFVEDQFSVVSAPWQTIDIPKSLVRLILVQPPVSPRDQDEYLSRIEAWRSVDETIWLRNDDLVQGKLIEINESESRIVVAGREIAVALDQIIAITMGQPLEGHTEPARERPMAIWGMRDGSQLRVRDWKLEGDRLQLTTVDGVHCTATSREGVVRAMQAWQSYDRSIVYLSDIEPAAYRHIPLLDTTVPLSRDRNVEGYSLRKSNTLYLKGLGMPTTARAAYTLEGSFRFFQAEIGVDDGAGGGGSVVFRLYGSRDGQAWQQAYESPTIRGTDGLLPISIALDREIRFLALIVDYADRGDVLDYADWLDVRLIH